MLSRPFEKGSPRLGDPDWALVERAKRGDGEAFEELVRRHADPLYSVVRRLGLPADAAEEVVQETFLRAWRGIGSFRAESRFFTWLYRIALNETRRELRRRARTPVSSLEEDGVCEPADPGVGPHALVERAELQVGLVRLVGGLGLKYRAPLVLRDVEGLSTVEAAAILGLSEAAFKSRLHRARVALHKALEAETESRRDGQRPGSA
jgi:RNA polymerase sigma-70 factor, ECF subfamily